MVVGSWASIIASASVNDVKKKNKEKVKGTESQRGGGRACSCGGVKAYSCKQGGSVEHCV